MDAPRLVTRRALLVPAQSVAIAVCGAIMAASCLNSTAHAGGFGFGGGGFGYGGGHGGSGFGGGHGRSGFHGGFGIPMPSWGGSWRHPGSYQPSVRIHPTPRVYRRVVPSYRAPTPQRIIRVYPQSSPTPATRQRVAIRPNTVVSARPRVATTPKPKPKPKLKANRIVIARPKCPVAKPPLDHRVWEVSVREAQSYHQQLTVCAIQRLDGLLKELGKGQHVIRMRAEIDEIRSLVNDNAAWRTVEPAIKRFCMMHTGELNLRARDGCRQLQGLLFARDACMVAAGGEARGRSDSLATGILPTGEIWVVYDPTLRVGSGLLVNSQVMVCGTDRSQQLQVARGSAARGLGLPVSNGTKLATIDASKLKRTTGVVIRASKDAPSPVHYVLNDRWPYSIKPGQVQALKNDKKWTATFARGDTSDVAHVSLTRPTYEFQVEDDRWTLKPVSLHMTIDNSDSQQDFQFVANDKLVTIKAGESKTIESGKPIVVNYSRGDGDKEPATVRLNKSGTFKPAVDESTNQWALFAETDDADGLGT